MVEAGRAFLRQLLVSGYDELKRRLTRRLGSSDEATEVLHETWLRLGQVTEAGAIQRPRSYLYRVALNVAVDRHRSSSRWYDKAELEALLHADDDQLDPEHIISIRSEMAALDHSLAQLPARRRAIFVAALVEELSYRDIAKRFGLSLRSVEREMAEAFDHCGKSFRKSPRKRRVGAGSNVLEMRKSGVVRDSTADSDHDE